MQTVFLIVSDINANMKIKHKIYKYSLPVLTLLLSSCSVMPDNTYHPTLNTGFADKIIISAESYLGVPYRFGGKSRFGMDCSGLVVAVYKSALDINLPHKASMLFKMGRKVSAANLKTGDLVFFKSGSKTISHVGIYLTNHTFIHASSSKGVIKSNIDIPYYKKRFIAARRIIKDYRY